MRLVLRWRRSRLTWIVKEELERANAKKEEASRKRLRISVKDILDWKIYDIRISYWRIVVRRHLNRRKQIDQGHRLHLSFKSQEQPS